jgi:hypothetical protein
MIIITKAQKVVLGGFCFFCGCLFLMVVLLNNGGSKNGTGGPEQMGQYLQNKYKKVFIVSNPEHFSGPLSGGCLIARAYPQEQPDLKFNVYYDLDYNKYGDSYVNNKFSKLGFKYLEEKLKDVYGEDNVILTEFKCWNIPQDAQELDYSQVLYNYADTMNVAFTYYVILNDIFEKNIEAEKVYKVLKNNVFNNNESRNYLNIGYIRKEGNDKLIQDLKTTNFDTNNPPNTANTANTKKYLLSYLSLDNKPDKATDIVEKFEIINK